MRIFFLVVVALVVLALGGLEVVASHRLAAAKDFATYVDHVLSA